MKKFLALVGACTTIFTSAFINNKVDAIIPNQTEDVVFLGDCNVGKYDIIKDICNNNPNNNLNNSSSNYFADVIDSFNVLHTINLIDTAGQGQYISLSSLFVRHSKVAVIVCNYDDLNSLINIDNWFNFVKDYNNDCQVIIAANNAGTANPAFTPAQVNAKGAALGVNVVHIPFGTAGIEQDIVNGCNIYDQIVAANMAATGAVNLNSAPTNEAKCC